MRSKARVPWDDTTYYTAPLPEYDALFDTNLRTHYEKGSVRDRLYSNNLIDRSGKILTANRTKLAMIEQEFEAAAMDDLRKQKMEEYERGKLEAKKYWVRQHEKKIQRSHLLRSREQAKRELYKEKVSVFLPPQTVSGSIMASTRRSGRRSDDDVDIRSNRLGTSRNYSFHKKDSPEIAHSEPHRASVSKQQTPTRSDVSAGKRSQSPSCSLSSSRASARNDNITFGSPGGMSPAGGRSTGMNNSDSDSESYEDEL
eukprot:TRINITY_DN26552_c0_g1_i1.p1 TRINITY_DN26552_c0_g1~~TRINITY_DN26552_c0_g1_i1.p1  ORF type:complete len:263 (+),score=51.65 TRINITY_DN26552_c0_g1_i1:24-791(+)